MKVVCALLLSFSCILSCTADLGGCSDAEITACETCDTDCEIACACASRADLDQTTNHNWVATGTRVPLSSDQYSRTFEDR